MMHIHVENDEHARELLKGLNELVRTEFEKNYPGHPMASEFYFEFFPYGDRTIHLRAAGDFNMHPERAKPYKFLGGSRVQALQYFLSFFSGPDKKIEIHRKKDGGELYCLIGLNEAGDGLEVFEAAITEPHMH